MAQKRMFLTFKETPRRGFYDEYPMLPRDVDLQLHLSRNDRAQPFHLICEMDTVLLQLSGKGRVEFKRTSVLYHHLELGDLVYVPGGTPHRLVPQTESVVYRYKAQAAGLEGIAWYCDRCGEEICREVWDTADELPQEAYLRICESFNRETKRRTCQSCGSLHQPVDIAGNNWAEIAAELRREFIPAAAQ